MKQGSPGRWGPRLPSRFRCAHLGGGAPGKAEEKGLQIGRTLALAAIGCISFYTAAFPVQSDSVSTERASVQVSAEKSDDRKPTPRLHVVLPGESLWTIARQYGTTVGALAQANGLRTDRALPADRKLTIPQAVSSKSPGALARSFYTVRRGDSLSRIAKRFGTTPEALAKANGLRLNGILREGVRLEVPASHQRASGSVKAPASKTQDDTSRLVETAMRYRGVRYRYGGITTRGMDCSGLVARVLDLNGIDAPHNSRALYQLGKAVSRDKLEPGDLVFFNTRGRGISHVGIYIGDSKFIHASSRGGRVRVDSLKEGYYQRRYVGARRAG